MIFYGVNMGKNIWFVIPHSMLVPLLPFFACVIVFGILYAILRDNTTKEREDFHRKFKLKNKGNHIVHDFESNDDTCWAKVSNKIK